MRRFVILRILRANCLYRVLGRAAETGRFAIDGPADALIGS